MPGSIRLPGPVYIESCGVLVCRGDVYRVEAALRKRVDVWPAGQQPGDREGLRGLHYEGGGLHARETVELCREVLSRAEAGVSLVYAHRGQRCQWQTPVLQSLLALLGPGVRAHGLQVEQGPLPLDLVLLGVATLAACGRCLIVKDDAIRVGAEEVAAVSTTQYLVLSRESGSWAVEEIALAEEAPARPSTSAAPSLDAFLAEGARGKDSLSLTCRTANGALGVLKLARGQTDQGSFAGRNPRQQGLKQHA